VLDTCEHVIDAAAAFAEAVLRAGSALHIIATSREPLRAEGEWVYAVRPLAVPADDAPNDQPLRYGAIRLFIERARAAGAHLVPDRNLMGTIAAICRRLDGIPLAIELAAARVVALGVDELATRLDDRLGLLSGGRRHALPRHQTLRATVDWSHALLADAERVVLRRLAVFAGAFGFNAASVVAARAEIAPSQVMDGLSSLLAKSLLTADAGGLVRRYRLLDTTRAYALEKLTESGEREQLARRHAEYYRDLFERADAEWETRPVTEWLAEYGREIDNLRAALGWAFSPAGEVSIGVALAAAAVPLWMHLSLLEECRTWMADALAAFPPEQLGTRQEMAVQLAFGYAIMITHRLSGDARAALERANALGDTLGDLDYQLRALACLVVFSRMSADFSPALALSRQVDAIAQQITTPLALGTANCLLASTLLWLGQYPEARTRAEAGSQQDDPEVRRAHRVRHGYDHWMNSRVLLAQIVWAQGFPERASQLLRDVVAEAEQMLHPFTLAYALTTGGCLVPLWTGDLRTAEPRISRLKEHAGRHALGSYYAAGLGFEGLLYAARGDKTTAVQLIRASISGLDETGFHLYAPVLLSGLAEILAGSDEVNEAMAAAADAVTRADRGNNGWWCRRRCASRARSRCARLPEIARRRRSFSAAR
jgi:predicted ATPase